MERRWLCLSRYGACASKLFCAGAISPRPGWSTPAVNAVVGCTHWPAHERRDDAKKHHSEWIIQDIKPAMSAYFAAYVGVYRVAGRSLLIRLPGDFVGLLVVGRQTGTWTSCGHSGRDALPPVISGPPGVFLTGPAVDSHRRRVRNRNCAIASGCRLSTTSAPSRCCCAMRPWRG
jgi:hypothetical protein